MLGLSESEITNIFKIISSILKLGNLNMVPTNNIDGTEGCIITNDYGMYFILNDFKTNFLKFFRILYL